MNLFIILPDSVDDSYVKSDDLNLINQTNQTHKIARGLSSIHAAKDYVEVLKAMMKEYGSAEFYFLGISYGTIVAQRASKIALENNVLKLILNMKSQFTD